MASFSTISILAPAVNPSDFSIGRFVMAGGWGTVYEAARNRDGKKIAMKFFGYTKRTPIMQEIQKEIELMVRLQGIEGVVQLEGVFNDTALGLVPNKTVQFRQPYPVIVMEMVEGGDLFDKIANRTEVSERYLANAFRSAMEALKGIHSRGYIHRDLKLDNLLLVSNEESSSIKVIDFGLMVQLSPGQLKYKGHDIVGTEGFFAPESILRFEYSAKSDIWQAGCILYCMLCGHPAFHSDERLRRHITHGSYYPMKGAEWANISDIAKDLVSKMLMNDSEQRISMTDILNHTWLAGSAPEEDLGDAYKSRVKALALRKTMRKIFMDRDIESEHRERLIKIETIGDSPKADTDSPISKSFRGLDIGEKLKNLKEILLNHLRNSQIEGSGVGRTEILKGEIDLEIYCNIMTSVGLEELASDSVFHIFDINHDGKIELKEFLLTLASFRAPDDNDAAVLYFNLFDLNEDGYIDKEELRAVVSCLLHDGTGPLLPEGTHLVLPSVDELFDVIDSNPRDGHIDIEEFKTFYHTVLLPTMSNSSSIRSPAMRS